MDIYRYQLNEGAYWRWVVKLPIDKLQVSVPGRKLYWGGATPGRDPFELYLYHYFTDYSFYSLHFFKFFKFVFQSLAALQWRGGYKLRCENFVRL